MTTIVSSVLCEWKANSLKGNSLKANSLKANSLKANSLKANSLNQYLLYFFIVMTRCCYFLESLRLKLKHTIYISNFIV